MLTTLLLQLYVPVESTSHSFQNCRLWQVPHSICSHQVNVQRHAIEMEDIIVRCIAISLLHNLVKLG